ncbi:hypothetical protein AVEN_97616-1 [Araneus ventricosus]|uniref:Uncharacterized protein n=1 Tax=Araneus ventricosus TaxID=182803 RepID=A0A4Y2GED0_ARAVE|nr:hypothetical protein AVEN_97616-1 [Araneus ventricosus]
MDQVIEQTANLDSNTKRGLKGFSRNPAAVHRWMLSHHLRAHICLSCEQLSVFVKKYKCKTVHFVTDTYPIISIKNSERERRSDGSEVVIRINNAHQKILKELKKFLANGRNKEALLNFIYEQWITNEPASFKTVAIYFSHGKVCHSIIPKDENIIVKEISELMNDHEEIPVKEIPELMNDHEEIPAKEIPELMNDHEEADTRLLLHAYYASKSSPAVLIKSLDADVFIL